MNIEKLEVGFTSIVDIGRCSYFIFVKRDGVPIADDELYENCRGYSKVVILGDEPLLQKEEVAKLARRLVRANPRVRIEIQTGGLIKPVDVSGYINNTTFDVFVKMKWEPEYKISETVLAWYVEAGANFVFRVMEKNDLDEITFICNSVGIKKSQAFLSPMRNISELQRLAKFYGYNLAPYVEWENG
jgi:hypothetical protein